MRTIIIGAGSIGTIMGAYLAKANENVELMNHNVAHVKALNEKGATITGTVQETIPVKAITESELTGIYDVAILLTKQVNNEETLHSILPYLHEQSIVLSLQNGIPEEKIASVVGKERVIGGSVEFGATLVGPGVSELTTDVETFQKYAFQIGELDGSITPRVQEMKRLLGLVGGTNITTNLIGSKWSKLFANVAMSGMSAALGGTFGDIANNDISTKSAIMLANETLEVGAAFGIEFAEIQGINLGVFRLKEDKSNLPMVMAIFRKAFEPQAMLKASMLQDLERGKRKTEVDYINGIIAEKGKEIGVPTPFNDLVVQLVKQAENNKSVPEFEQNLVLFDTLVQKEM